MGKKKWKKRKSAALIGEGIPCPRCKRTMGRYEHGPNWRPKQNQPYYFRYWDKCRCGYMQLYEAAKVHCIEENPLDAEYREVMRQ